MRLIDADKEIEKLEKKIESLKEELRWLRTNKPDQVSKTRYLQDQIHDFEYQIRIFNSLETAYDLNKLMDGLNEILKDEISQPVADCVYECVQQGFLVIQ